MALGESQSAFYLTTFADTLQPLTNTFDGIFIHSRAGTGGGLDGRSGAGRTTSGSGPTSKVPVFMFETQTDLIALGYAAAQQPDTDRIRTWEVAGTSHADAYEVGAAVGRVGLHHTGQRRAAAQRGPGRVHRVRPVGRARHTASQPASLSPVLDAPRRPGPRRPRQRDRRGADARRRRPGLDVERGRSRRGRARSARSSARRRRSPRPRWSSCIGPRATILRCTRPVWTRPSPVGSSWLRTGRACSPRRSRCSCPRRAGDTGSPQRPTAVRSDRRAHEHRAER